MRLALAQLSDFIVELIQPLSQHNIYAEQLARKGEGLARGGRGSSQERVRRACGGKKGGA